MTPDPDVEFTARLRRLRSVLGITQNQMAQILGTSFASVNRWENGQTRPSRMAWDLLRRAEEKHSGSDRHRTPVGGSSQGVVDFLASSEQVHLVAEAERLSFGHMFNPAFATETSLIDPLPHQRLAVYEHMLEQPRLRFLLADDAGAGKTIMTALYIREMLARRLLRRILIVPPAGLIGNWERELRILFGLEFRIIRGPDARGANPFIGSEGDRLICRAMSASSSRGPPRPWTSRSKAIQPASSPCARAEAAGSIRCGSPWSPIQRPSRTA